MQMGMIIARLHKFIYHQIYHKEWNYLVAVS